MTTVGATTGIGPEVGVEFSGGGFSNYFTRPKYQKKAVRKYLGILGNTNNGLYK